MDNAFIQTARVIVDVHRQQAGSYNFESCEPNHRVGAGLLAIAVGQSTHLLAGRTLSPASRLLQLIGVMANYRAYFCCFALALVLVLALALAFDFDFDFDLPRREAEWRFCAVGNPAWMPG
ncbi:hypothetical protein ACYZUC_09230 [Pseudomonas sp. GT1P32]